MLKLLNGSYRIFCLDPVRFFYSVSFSCSSATTGFNPDAY